MLDLPLSAKQFQSVREADARVNVWHGAVRSGKTVASLLRWLIYVSTNKTQGELVVVSRTRASAARNVFALLRNPDLFGPAARLVNYTPGAETGEILGRKVWVLGSSDIRSENVLRGMTCSGAYVDEATLLQEDFFVQLLNRLWHGAQLFATTNPDNPAHWLKRKYLDRLIDLPDWRTWHFLLDDNPQLHEDQKAAIRRENVGLYYRRNVLGEWVAAEGAVYPMWDPDVHVVPWSTLPDMWRQLAVGIDYGTTNPTAALLLGLGIDRRLYLMDEWRYDPAIAKARLSDGELSAGFRNWLAAGHTPQISAHRPEWIIVDPSAASFKTQLDRDGVRGITDADNDVAFGIRTIATLLAKDQLRVADRCQGFIVEAPGYSWDEKATLQGQDKPMKVADHSLDGGRYAIATTEALWREELRDTIPAAA